MPSAVMPQRRRREDGLGDTDDEEFVASFPRVGDSHNTKRSRLNLNGDASPSQSPLLREDYRSNGNEHLIGEALQRGSAPSRYQPGSIVRVKLANFVTYTAVEFFPGPSLNMVIGPNGTGKSTLVCAICLGLGWGPQHLGRAKEVSEFVKHGSQEAMIEIELAGWPDEQNPVIKCKIKREGSKSHWFIDNSPTTRKRVMELARSYSIQIDNLCQFLPQDKVVEFAAMTPVDLLRSTQQAVASQEMIDWHESLKEQRSSQRTIQAQKASDVETLAGLDSRQRMQEADVERMREREQVKLRVKHLEAARPFAEYRAARIAHQEAKDRRKDITEELGDLKQEVEPTLRAVNSKQRYRDQIKLAVDERQKFVAMIDRKATGYSSRMEGIERRIQELDAEKESEKNGYKESKREATRLEGVVRGLKRQMEEPPVEFDIVKYSDRIREKSREAAAYVEKAMELKNSMRGLESSGKERSTRIRQARQDLEKLETHAGQQTKKLERISRETAIAWEWIQENQDRFEKHVYGPPIVECSVKDPKYVDVVEACFGKTDFICFTVQTRADFNKLHHTLHKELRLSEVNIRTMTGGLENFHSPVDEQELRIYGLDAWALDYVAGPEPVLAMLCSDGPRLHLTGVAIRDTTSQQYEMLQDSRIACWVTSKSFYRINRRREYGPGAISTQVREVKAATLWTDQPVDMIAKRELQQNIEGWTEEINAWTEEIHRMRKDLAKLGEQNHQAENEKRDIELEKAEKQKAAKAFNALPTRLAQQEQKLTEFQRAMAGVHQRVLAHEDKQDEFTLEKGQAALDYANAVDFLCKAHEDLYEAELMLIEATSDFDTLTQRNRAIKDQLETKEREVEEANRTVTQTGTNARKILDKCQEILAERREDPALDAFINTIPEGQRLEDLNTEIETNKARLELMHEGNGGILREFERRQKQIDALKGRLEEIEQGLAELDAKITEIRSKWEPQLDRLVKRISDSFAYNMKQINCAGEVSVYKDEDFDQWAIQIQVKFRENEPLTILDSHRQSGGERAVSTIFYLMSLQSLTRSPFRVVDEINQGMDPRNERLVHARMVSIATGNDEQVFTEDISDGGEGDGRQGGGDGEEVGRGAGGSQYFLITPKLLHGLRYERGMRVLCIASGEYMPKDQTCVDFKACVDTRRGFPMRSVAAAR